MIDDDGNCSSHENQDTMSHFVDASKINILRMLDESAKAYVAARQSFRDESLAILDKKKRIIALSEDLIRSM